MMRRIAPFLLIFLINGCTHLKSVNLAPETTSAPSDAEIWKMLDTGHRDDCFVLLNDGPTALDWRLRAIDTAVESIDLQTFLWTFDTSGALVLDHLIVAAERGVKVKLLIDDTFLAGQEEILLELIHHPNIEYRVYNPFKRRADGLTTRWALNLSDFGRLNHRMHNKAMIIDNRVAIVGGRNLADEYFGLHGQANFRDLEVIVGGPVTRSITRAFDTYWNDHWSVPIDQLTDVKTTPVNLEKARDVRDRNQHVHAEESEKERMNQWRTLIDSSIRGKARLFVDKPPVENPADLNETPDQVADALVELFENAREEILIVSAYLIPTERLETHIAQAIDRGVRVRILTNSIGSNNHLAAHSAYRHHIQTLLAHGAELHEVRVDAKDRQTYMLTPIKSKALALHAKALVVDKDKVFIGSANLDPRSLRINTEMGLLIKSSHFNANVRDALHSDFDTRNSWQLQYDSNGRLTWVSDDVTLTSQPAPSFMSRIEDWFFSHLPIEDEL